MKRHVPGGRRRLRFPDADALRRATHVLRVSTPDEETLSSRVPTDGTPADLRAIIQTAFTLVVVFGVVPLIGFSSTAGDRLVRAAHRDRLRLVEVFVRQGTHPVTTAV